MSEDLSAANVVFNELMAQLNAAQQRIVNLAIDNAKLKAELAELKADAKQD